MRSHLGVSSNVVFLDCKHDVFFSEDMPTAYRCGRNEWPCAVEILVFTNQGGAEKVKLVDRAAFHAFPTCSWLKDLAVHVGEWPRQMPTYAIGIPDIHLQQRLFDILPENIKTEIVRRKLGNLDEMLAFTKE